MDLDSHAYLLDSNNKLVEHVSFSNLKGAGVRLNGDNMTGKGVRVFHFADLVKINGKWSFEAIGNPCEGKLSQIEQVLINKK